MGQTTLGDSHVRWKNFYVLADRSRAWLSSERQHQRLTERDADAHSQSLDSDPYEEFVNELKELQGKPIP